MIDEPGIAEETEAPFIVGVGASAGGLEPATHQELHEEADRAVLAACGPPGMVVAEDGTVVQFRGALGPFLAPVSGAASLGLLRLAREELRPALRETLDEAHRTSARSHAARVRLRDADGDRWVDVEVLPITAPAHAPRHYVVLFRDAAPAGGAELLRDARDYAQGIVDTVREPLLVLDEQLRVRSANRSYYERFHVAPTDTEDKRVDEILAGSWGAVELRRYLQDAGAGAPGEGFRLEREEGGERRSLVLHANRLPRGLHGSPWILVSVADVTQREQADAVRERAGRALRKILAASTTAEGILIVDRRRKIVFANRTAKLIFGYGAGELVGLPVDDLLPSSMRSQHEAHVRLFQEAPTPRPMFKGRVVTARRKDGTEVPLEVGLGVVQDEGGPLTVAFCTDVAARRESEAQIHAYEAKLGDMAFDAAVAEERERRRIARDLHDHVGQALALLQIRLTTLRDTLPGESREGVTECIRTIEQSIADTRALTFELSPPILHDFGLKAAVTWLAEQFAARDGLAVTVEGFDALELDVDVACVLFRVVRELLNNVMKHAHSPGAKVIFHREGESVGIDVEDGGVGFDAAILGSREMPGFGLFSVREQIGRLGGTFALTSGGGSGTRVSLRVPVTARAPAGSAGSEA